MANDWDKIALAFDLLESADVMEEFDDHVWLRVDAALWADFVMFTRQEMVA